MNQLLPVPFRDLDKQNVFPLFDLLNKFTSLLGNRAQNRIFRIKYFDERLTEEGRETFHFPDLINDHNFTMFGWNHGRDSYLINIIKVDTVFSHPESAPDVLVGEYAIFPVQRCNGKSDPFTPFSYLPGKKPGHWLLDSANNPLDEGRFPTSWKASHKNIFARHLF